MTLIAAKPQVTPDDLLNLDEQGLFELVDGKLVEKQMSYLSGKTAVLVSAKLFSYVSANRLGDVLSETSFRCFPDDPDKIRRPDIAFITASRALANPPEGHIAIAPDIAIEIVSPNDKIYEMDEKLADYRAAGVKFIWVINPQSRIIRAYGPDHYLTELFDGDTLRGDPVLPGFAIAVQELLPNPVRQAT